MTGFTLIDGIVAAVIVLSAILAYARGFVRESLAILGWIGAAILAFLFAAAMRPLIAQVPVLNRFLADRGVYASELGRDLANLEQVFLQLTAGDTLGSPPPPSASPPPAQPPAPGRDPLPPPTTPTDGAAPTDDAGQR